MTAEPQKEKASRRAIHLIPFYLLMVVFFFVHGGMMTYNRLTLLGWLVVVFIFLGLMALSAVYLRTGNERLIFLMAIPVLLYLALVCAVIFLSPQESPGLLIDTSEAWRRYSR